MRRYDLIYGIDEIFVTTGGSQSSFLALQACLDPGGGCCRDSRRFLRSPLRQLCQDRMHCFGGEDAGGGGQNQKAHMLKTGGSANFNSPVYSSFGCSASTSKITV